MTTTEVLLGILVTALILYGIAQTYRYKAPSNTGRRRLSITDHHILELWALKADLTFIAAKNTRGNTISFLFNGEVIEVTVHGLAGLTAKTGVALAILDKYSKGLSKEGRAVAVAVCQAISKEDSDKLLACYTTLVALLTKA